MAGWGGAGPPCAWRWRGTSVPGGHGGQRERRSPQVGKSGGSGRIWGAMEEGRRRLEHPGLRVNVCNYLNCHCCRGHPKILSSWDLGVGTQRLPLGEGHQGSPHVPRNRGGGDTQAHPRFPRVGLELPRLSPHSQEPGTETPRLTPWGNPRLAPVFSRFGLGGHPDSPRVPGSQSRETLRLIPGSQEPEWGDTQAHPTFLEAGMDTQTRPGIPGFGAGGH